MESSGSPQLFHRVGLLVLSDERNDTTSAIETNAALHGVSIQKLSHSDLHKRFPQFAVPETFFGIFEEAAGFLEAETSVRALFELSEKAGVRFLEDEVIQWSSSPSGVEIRTTREILSADILCLCAGAWAASLLGEFGMQLTVRRAPQFWFSGNASHHEASGMPCFAFARRGLFVYGFPHIDGWGVKVASHSASEPVVDLLSRDTTYSEREIAPVLSTIEAFIPGLSPTPIRSHICKYTLTKDENFLIGKHPQHDNVVLAGGGSGHAFKFLPVIGEIVSQIALNHTSTLDADFLKFRREP
jgi:glycine/D-amino acid oxidase-like deaminating enzyme